MASRFGCTRTFLAAAMLPLILAGCPWEVAGEQVEGDPALIPFGSRAALLEYFKEQATESVQGSQGLPMFGLGLFGGLPMMGAAAPVSARDELAAGSPIGDAATGTDPEAFTTTNIQEAGVDESDVVKSDGTHFYIARGNTLRIVRAVPVSEMAEVGRIEFDEPISELYLFGSRVIVLNQRNLFGGRGDVIMDIWPPYYEAAGAVVHQVDVSDPADPSIERRMELEGSLASSRLTNERLILVLTIVPELPRPTTGIAIATMGLDDVMPKARSSSGEREMVEWENWLRPESPDGYRMTAVVTLDANDVETIVASTAVMANAGTIYASTEALYLTDAEYDPANNYREQVAIHKLAFDENGAAQYVASGSAPGRLLNQFSLGEHEGHLRVATHVENFGMSFGPMFMAELDVEPAEPFNAVYVLGESSSQLEIVGRVENIARNETLHSSRFMGERGFLVTFRKIDPLFVLDLRDPADPKIVGELKVPGFSDYLHPLDETHLIGVGKATVPTEQGFDWFQGVQISLFDVSDWTNPTVVQQITLGGRGSGSEVDFTHKAFTLLPESGLLAIPMRLFSERQTPFEYGEFEFDGIVAFRVDAATGFTELGRVEMSSNEYGAWGGSWRRAAFIGDVLYGLSAERVRAASVEDFTEISTLDLEP